MYSNLYKEKLGTKFLEYVINLQTTFVVKLKSQFCDKIVTKRQELTNVKFESADSIEFMNNEFKLHELFAPKGTKISGKIVIYVQADVPGLNGNMQKQYTLEVNFNSTHIRFSFEKENFEIKGDINIAYISNS